MQPKKINIVILDSFLIWYLVSHMQAYQPFVDVSATPHSQSSTFPHTLRDVCHAVSFAVDFKRKTSKQSHRLYGFRYRVPCRELLPPMPASQMSRARLRAGRGARGAATLHSVPQVAGRVVRGQSAAHHALKQTR